MELEEAIQSLLKSLPRCCNCEKATCVVIDAHRWPLCEKCWVDVPGSDNEKPTVDMRLSLRDVYKELGERSAMKLITGPARNVIPPPPVNPPTVSLEEVREIEAKNKRLLRKIRHMRDRHDSAIKRRIAISFLSGISLGGVLAAIIHYL